MFRRIFGSSSKTPKPGRESAAREGDTVYRDAPPEPDTVDTVDADEDHGLHSDEEDVAAEPSNTDAFAPELRALFNSNLLSDHRAHAGKISALAQSLETHPAPVPKDIAPAVSDAIVTTLNAKGVSPAARTQAARLIAAIASHPWNHDLALGTLRRCDATFEHAFEHESLHCEGHGTKGGKGRKGKGSKGGGGDGSYSSACSRPLHLHVLVATLRIFGDDFRARELLEMHSDSCDAAVCATLQLLDRAASSSNAAANRGDARRLASRACGLLHSLTTPQAHFLEGDRNETAMTELAKQFRRIVGDLTRAFIERDAPRRLVAALEGRIEGSRKAHSEDAASFEEDEMNAAGSAIMATRNLLLHSDERGAQLRKALAQSEMTVRVLEPFLARAVRDARDAEAALDEEDDGICEDGDGAGDDGWGERRHYERTRRLRSASTAVAEALNALVVATHKDGTLRQRLLCGAGGEGATMASALIPGGVLSVESLACNLGIVDALCRLACNLGVAVGDDGGGAPAADGRARWIRELTERCIDRLDGDAAVILSTRFAEDVRSAPVTRDCATHGWLVTRLPEPTAPRRAVEEALKGGGGGGGGGGRRNRRKGKGKGKSGGGGESKGGGSGGGKTEREKARKRDQKRRKKQREKEAKEATRKKDELDASSEIRMSAVSPPRRVVGSDAADVVEVRRVIKPDDDDGGDSSLGGDSSGDDETGPRVNEFKIGFSAPRTSSHRPVFVNPLFGGGGENNDKLDEVDALLDEVDRLGFN